MPHASQKYSYRDKAVRITVPLVSDEHIREAADQFEKLAADLKRISGHGGREFERVLAAQSRARFVHNELLKQARGHIVIKGLR
jgi:bacterioferritin-associated ferredoxin